jgi:hypothetical protein
MTVSNSREQHTFYCVPCREKKSVDAVEFGRARNGGLYLRTHCPDCGTVMFKFQYADFSFETPPITPKVIHASSVLTRRIADHLARNDQELYSIPHSYFEKLVAEILASYGFDVQLNVRLLEPGGDEADVIAFSPVRGMLKRVGYVVECKRFAEHRKVDLRIATRLYGLKQVHAERWGLDRALLATTSSVTSEVIREYGERWDFEIRDHSGVVEWLKAYSKAANSCFLREQGLYKPARELTITSVHLLSEDG